MYTNNESKYISNPPDQIIAFNLSETDKYVSLIGYNQIY